MAWTNWPMKDFKEFKDLRSIIEDPFFNDFLSLSDFQKPKDHMDKDWKIRLDVRGFKAENVNVVVSGEKVIVHAEEKDGDDYTAIKRHFPIPEGLDVKAITSKISSNGVLVVSAPYLSSEYKLRNDMQDMQAQMNKVLEELVGKTGRGDALIEKKLDDEHKQQLRSLLKMGDLSCQVGGVANITEDQSGNRNYEIGFNLKQYTPEEIQLKLKGYKLLLDAKHEENSPGHHVSRVVHKSVTLPVTIDTNAMKSVMRSDGLLQVKAPLLPDSAAREIPICFDNMLEKV